MTATLRTNGFLGQPDRHFKQSPVIKAIRVAMGKRQSDRPSIGFAVPFRFVVELRDEALVFYKAEKSGHRGPEAGRLPLSEISEVLLTPGPLPALAVRREGEPDALRLVLGMTAADAEENAAEFAAAITQR